MLNIKNIAIAAFSLTLLSCEKEFVSAPYFEVTTDRPAYKAGDTVLFRFQGEPDLITFYSGETGNEYRYKDRTEVTGAKTELEFTSRVLYGTQANNLTVMASTDFGGNYETEGIRSATWTDITDRFILPSTAGLSANTPSGKSDITDLLVKGKPIYLAYRYYGEKPAGTTPTQRTWRIVAFSLTNSFGNGGSSTLATLVSAGWIPVDVINPANKWTVSSSMIQLAPNSTMDETEDWIITKPIYPTRVAPDAGEAIKEYSQRKNEHSHVFEQPGTYTVTFVASNVNYKGEKTVVKELQLTIEP